MTREVAGAKCNHEYECPEDTYGSGYGSFHVHVFSSLSPK